MMRPIALLFLIWLFSDSLGVAQNVESYGVFGGLNFPITIDQGLNKDPRYFGRFTVRGSPVGFIYGYDRVGWGYVITPNYTSLGQKFIIKNTEGGGVGTRDIQMNYLSVPVALKLHINDLAFFRLSAVAAVNFQFLLKGQETFTHEPSKLRFPSGVAIPARPGYESVYDGVFVPQENGYVHVSRDKFNPFQLFAAVGLRSDFDINDDWSINFDGRANFGLFDPRKGDYIDLLKTADQVPDVYGQRREIFLSVGVGVSRIIQSKNKFKTKVTKMPMRGQAPKPRNQSKSKRR